MRNLLFLVVVFSFLFTDDSFGQSEKIYKVSEPSFWQVLKKIGDKVREDGSKKHEFDGWLIYFPKRYVNFVKKFPKNGGTFEYYVKVNEKGIYDPKIRFKEGPGKSSITFEDSDGKETKLLIAAIYDVLSKLIGENKQLLSSK